MKLKEIIKTINLQENDRESRHRNKRYYFQTPTMAGEGSLFCAVRGDNTDGHKYIESAISNGANSVLLQDMPDKHIRKY